MKLKSKIAIVTGGSSGIGQAGAISLAREGADILITYRSNEKGAIDTKNKIIDLGRKCEIIKADLENIDDIRIIVKSTIEKYSGIDILVNNAGDCKGMDFLDDNIENLDYLLNANLKSIFILSQLVAKEMIKRGGGSIINITSVSGIVVDDTKLVSYCTSKAAANMLTKGMAKALGKYNIRVNAILPGTINTPLLRRETSKDEAEIIKEKTPLKILGQPEDISEIIVFLSSYDSKFITGSLIVADGGFTI